MVFWRFLAGFGAALNVVDALATIAVLRIGVEEANPLMALLYVLGLPFFLAMKLLAVLFFYFLTVNHHRPLAKVGIAIGVISYVGVSIVHFLGWTHM